MSLAGSDSLQVRGHLIWDIPSPKRACLKETNKSKKNKTILTPSDVGQEAENVSIIIIIKTYLTLSVFQTLLSTLHMY